VEAATDGAPLSFTAPDVLARVESRGDLFEPDCWPDGEESSRRARDRVRSPAAK
jgi:hypothetical protein